MIFEQSSVCKAWNSRLAVSAKTGLGRAAVAASSLQLAVAISLGGVLASALVPNPAHAQGRSCEQIIEIAIKRDGTLSTIPDKADVCDAAMINAGLNRQLSLIDMQLSEGVMVNSTDLIRRSDWAPEVERKLFLYTLNRQSKMKAEEVLPQLRKVFEESLENDDFVSAAVAGDRASFLARTTGQLELAEEYLERAEAAALRGNLKTQQLLLAISHATLAQSKQDYQGAISAQQRALEMAKKLDRRDLQASIHASIGNILYSFGDLEGTLAEWTKTREIFEERPDLVSARRFTIYYTNLGKLLQRQGKFEESLETLDLALKYGSQSETNRVEGLTNAFRAQTLLELGRADEALETAKRAAEQSLEYRAPAEAAEIFTWIAMRELEAGNTKGAQNALSRASTINGVSLDDPASVLEMDGAKGRVRDYAAAMGELMYTLGDPDKGYKYTRIALDLTRERFDEEQVEAVGNLRMLLDLRDQQAEAELARSEARISNLRAERRQYLFYLAIAAAVGAALVAFAFRRSFVDQRKLATANETFLKELNHRVGNHLQILQSLLRSDIGNASEAKEKSKNQQNPLTGALSRVTAMSLLHAQLSRSPGSTVSNAKLYLEELLTSLQHSASADTLEVECDIEECWMDVATLTPLGLIVSEVIINASKHAFPNRDGKITVKMWIEHGATSQLVIQDNGVGLNNRNQKGSGFQLIQDLADQIGASTQRAQAASGGLKWTIKGIPVSGQPAHTTA